MNTMFMEVADAVARGDMEAAHELSLCYSARMEELKIEALTGVDDVLIVDGHVFDGRIMGEDNV